MKNLKIKAKLLLGFSMLIAMTIVVGMFGALGLNSIDRNHKQILDRNTAALSALGDMRELYLQQRLVFRGILMDFEDKVKYESYTVTLRSYETAMLEAMANYEEAVPQENRGQGYASFRENYLDGYAKVKERFISVAAGEDYAGTMAAHATGAESAAAISADIQKTIDELNAAAKADAEGAAADVKQMTALLVGAIVLALIAAVILGLHISGLIGKPILKMTTYMKKVSSTGDMNLTPADTSLIEESATMKDEIGELVRATAGVVQRILAVTDALQQVAKGDLTVELPLLSHEDAMGQALRDMTENLNHMFGEIQNATNMVADGSRQVSDGAQTLAQGSTEQAAAIEQLSASVTEIAKQTRENAEQSDHASRLASAIKHNAEKGSVQMDSMLEAVKEIQGASMSIGKVIKVIDDIAFQTNILALNAAVEAARAGQHGKGFAVVAEEVRNLAAKSAAAAKDTESLIANSMEKSELGARIAEETALSLSEIVNGINESGQIVESIARSSEEQAVAISEINTGIDQVAQVVQQNSATAQESASAAEEMSEQSEKLEELTERFQLKGQPAPVLLPKKTVTMPEVPQQKKTEPMGKY